MPKFRCCNSFSLEEHNVTDKENLSELTDAQFVKIASDKIAECPYIFVPCRMKLSRNQNPTPQFFEEVNNDFSKEMSYDQVIDNSYEAFEEVSDHFSAEMNYDLVFDDSYEPLQNESFEALNYSVWTIF